MLLVAKVPRGMVVHAHLPGRPAVVVTPCTICASTVSGGRMSSGDNFVHPRLLKGHPSLLVRTGRLRADRPFISSSAYGPR
jgi:hypothetical protein